MLGAAASSGVPSLVLDPLGGEWPDAAYVTDNTDTFIDVAFANQNCLLIIDEAGEAIGAARSQAHQHRIKLATRSRHQGHTAVFIAQKYTLINATIRAQCERLWLFRQHKAELDQVSKDFARDDFTDQARALGRGDYLYIPVFGDICRQNVFDNK